MKNCGKGFATRDSTRCKDGTPTSCDNSFNMVEILLSLYLVFLALGFILSVRLLYQDIRPYVQNICRCMSPRGARRQGAQQIDNAHWKRYLAIVYGVCQLSILAADIAIIVVSLKKRRPAEVIELMILCAIQLLWSTNLARIFRGWAFSTHITMVPYVFVTFSISCGAIVYQTNHKQNAAASHKIHSAMAIYNIVLLFVLSIVSILPTRMSIGKHYQHKNSGASPPNRVYLGLLAAVYATNIVAIICMSIGAGLLIKFFFIDEQGRKGDLRDRSLLINLVSLTTQILCTSVFCSGLIEHRIIQPVRDIHLNLSAFFLERGSTVDLRPDQSSDPEAISLESISH